MMIDVWSAVRWWDEWQLRILVLGSLGLQWFLLVAAPMRKYTIPRLLRTCIWLAYVSSDALAIYALATLFNRHAKARSGASCGGTNANGGQAGVLEILWAPVLLIHLGGQRELTAYNIEDNELWTRHAVTLVSQVAVAVYAFYKLWPNSTDKRLWVSAILMFVIGVLSFSEKPWAFKRARIQKLAAVSSLVQGTTRHDGKWEKAYRFCFTDLEEQSARKRGLTTRNRVHMLLSDMSLFAAVSELKRRGVLDSVDQEGTAILSRAIGAERFSKRWLQNAFGLIYTRAKVTWTPAYLAYHLLLVPALHVASITLFAVSHKRGRYNATDVKITYILLCFTAVLDISAFFFRGLIHLVMFVAKVPSLCEWIAQYNLIDAALRRLQPTGWLIKCATRIGCYEGYFDTKHDKLYSKVAGYLVFDLLRSDQIEGLDLGSYRNLDSEMNNWILSHDLGRRACGEGTEVRSTLLGSFDRSVLFWHIATDLCFTCQPPTFPAHPREVITEAISNYMAHLLNFRPDMLLTGSRQHLFAEAMQQVEAILKLRAGRHFKRPSIQDDMAMVDTIFMRSTSGPGPNEYPLVHEACRLTQELLLLDDETRCELMYHVWVGMLFYSAAMCRGYLHAKSLGEGGEFLSFVWLLLSIKGTKTLSDKLQMPDQPNAPVQQHAQGSQQGKVFQKQEDWELI
ncbi:uncharacterized protein [Oryza sativa Japonica Group]|nr:uncharacterized protein LOC112936417 [Oryza sativa Japonica Group]KAB8111722.1 hypothetical protein EE612_049487 [Oryza sativa]BAT09417.1 Os09g0562750 [Oryza sativa Japonica Group]